jgi:hypothetical protein
MAFVTGLFLEGDQSCDIDEPTWTDVENLLSNIVTWDHDEPHATLTMTGQNEVQLSLSLGHLGGAQEDLWMVNWHDWNGKGTWVVLASDIEPRGTVFLRDAAYPARNFVPLAAAREAARAFFADGTRAAGLKWGSPDSQT